MESKMSCCSGQVKTVEPIAVPEMFQVIEDMERDISVTYDLVEKLVIRLGPIMNQNPETCKDPFNKAYSVPMAERIEAINNRIRLINQSLYYIMKSLAI
jgi:hypothetical protein